MSRKLLAAALAATAGIVTLVLSSQPKTVYAYGVRDFLDREVREREVRINGLLVHGSLCRIEPECGYRFSLSDRSLTYDAAGSIDRRTLDVQYDGCVIPDTFRDVPHLDIDISVQGERCQTCHALEASQIMAKCPGKYEMKPRGSAHVPAAPPRLCDPS